MPKDCTDEFNSIIKDLKARKFKPIYLLHGEENYFIDEISNYIEHNVLTEGEKAFNQTIFYPKDKDIEPAQIMEAARRFPMMAEHQLIIVKEAQNFKRLDEFVPYFEKPVKSTILVLCHKGKKVDGRLKLLKVAKKHVTFESKVLYDDGELQQWIENYMRAHGFTISRHQCDLIADHIGSNLSKITNELNKLIIVKDENKEVSDAEIEEYIGISKDFNVFELLSAVANHNSKKAFYISHYLSNTKDFSPIPFISQVNSLFAKAYLLKQNNATTDNAMKAYGIYNFKQAKDFTNLLKNYPTTKILKAMQLAAQYDLKSKGINQQALANSELMKEFLFNIFA